MATAKPKVKRMMFGGAAKAVGKAVATKAAPMRTQSQMQSAARSAAAQQAAPMRTQSQMQAAARAQQGARPVTPTPSMNKMYADFQAQKSGKMGTGSQSAPNKMRGVIGPLAAAGARGMMKKGGAVKKATKK
jgi:hypothetical protein